MPIRHPSSRRAAVPAIWLMTDERMGERLWDAVAGLPRGSAIVLRHFRTAPAERAVIAGRVARYARRKGLLVFGAGERDPLRLYPAHSLREAAAAHRAGADAILVSPVFPTRTHPGMPTLGPVRAARIARSVPIPAIALGGMTRARFKRMKALGFVGWAAIDGLTPDQKRKAVPI